MRDQQTIDQRDKVISWLTVGLLVGVGYFALSAWDWFIWPASVVVQALLGHLLPYPASMADVQANPGFYFLTWLGAMALSLAAWVYVPLALIGLKLYLTAKLLGWALGWWARRGAA